MRAAKKYNTAYKKKVAIGDARWFALALFSVLPRTTLAAKNHSDCVLRQPTKRRNGNSVSRTSSSEITSGVVMNVKTGNELVETTVTILTAMENRVLTLVTLAKTNKEIAAELGISPATVKRHIENLLRKFKLKNRVEAAVYGLMIKGCAVRDRSTCALEVWRNRKPDYENGPIGP